MPKLFGEFLVEQRLIGEDQLAQALVEQVRLMPSTVEVIYTSRLLPNAKIIEILKCQQTTGRDFRSAAKFLGFWTKDLETSVETLLQKARTPLGELLLKQNAIAAATLAQALDQYIINSCSIDRDAYVSLVGQFSREVKEDLEPLLTNTISILKAGSQDSLKPNFENIIASIHRITVISSPVRIEMVQNLIRDLNASFAHIHRELDQISQEDLLSFLTSCKDILLTLTPQLLYHSNGGHEQQELQEGLRRLHSHKLSVTSQKSKTVA